MEPGVGMTLWLVRHAQPLIAPGICYGATDVAAQPRATLAAARALARQLPQGLTVRASPLQRCEQLTQCLRSLRPDLICKTEPRLSEMNFGCWEGQCWDAIPQADYARWLADFGQHRFGGQESAQELMQRVAAVWDETRLAGGESVWITHAGVIRAATLLAQGVRRLQQAAQWPRAAPPFGGWCQLQG